MPYSTTNPVLSSYSLIPGTVGLVSATMNVSSSLLATSTNHPTIISNTAVSILVLNPVTYPTITSSCGTTPFAVSTVDLMSSIVATIHLVTITLYPMMNWMLKVS